MGAAKHTTTAKAQRALRKDIKHSSFDRELLGSDLVGGLYTCEGERSRRAGEKQACGAQGKQSGNQIGAEERDEGGARAKWRGKGQEPQRLNGRLRRPGGIGSGLRCQRSEARR